MGKRIYKIAEVLRDGIKCSGIIMSISVGFGVDFSNILYDMSHKELSRDFFLFLFYLSSLSAYSKQSFGEI